MKLETLTMHNFMPYRGQHSLEFPQDEVRNVLVVLGDNMRGKTSLLNAIRWVLYGNALGRHLVEIPLPRLVNSEAAAQGDWSMSVVLRFVALGSSYVLTRTATKKEFVSTPTRPDDFVVSVFLERDGDVLLADDIDREIAKFAPEQVSRFFLFDGELLQEYETLLIEGSTQGKRIREAIEGVLGVPALTLAVEDITTLLRRAQKRQANDLVHVQAVAGLLASQATAQAKLERAEADRAAQDELLTEVKRKRIALEEQLDESDAVYADGVTLSLVRQQLKDVKRRQDELKAASLKLAAASWKDLFVPALKKRRDSIEARRIELKAIVDGEVLTDARLAALRVIVQDEVCPTCGEHCEDSTLARASAAIAAMDDQLRQRSDSVTAMWGLAQEIRNIDDLLVPSVIPQLEQNDSQNMKLEVELTNLENEADRLAEALKGFDTAAIAKLRGQRDDLLVSEGTFRERIDESDRDLTKLQSEVAKISGQIDAIPEARGRQSTKLVQIYESLKTVFGSSIAVLRDSLREDVERYASDAFRKMTTQGSYSGLSINEHYGLSILDENGAAVPQRSAGAEQVVALSLIDGLAKAGKPIGPIVMDTPFGRMDLKHRKQILQYLPTSATQLVLLVHDGEIRGEEDLLPIAGRIGARYTIREISPRESMIERM